MPFDTSGNYYNDGSDVSEYDSDLEESQNPLAPHPQLALRNPPPTPAQDAYSKTGAALSAQGNVRPSLWRSLLAGGAEFMLGKSHPQAAQVFGDAITQTDPSVRANMNLQRTYQIQGQQAQAERLKQAQERMERQNQSLVGLKMQAERDRLENQRAQRLNQAVDKGFTPSPSSVDIPAPGAVSSPDLPPTLQVMSPQTMNTPLPAGALPPLAPIGSTPARVSGQQGYYIPPDARERMKKQADAKATQDARQQALQERGIPTPPAIKAALGANAPPAILIEDLPKYADILKNPPRVPLDQQYVDEYLKTHPGSSLADAIKAHKRDTMAPEKDPTAMMIDPTGVARVVRPGMQVAPGSVTPAGMSSQNVPTSQTRTMAEVAPKVIDLSARVGALIDQQEKTLGPAASRWSEFMAGKVGAPNPEFTKLRTDVGLLQTLLMRMHVGARGGEQIMSHFRDLLDSSKQSPENLRAALGEIKLYAEEVAKAGKSPGGTPPPSPSPPDTSTAPKIVKWGRDANGNPVPLP